jgi:7-cyano-7-deazaguanine synthase
VAARTTEQPGGVAAEKAIVLFSGGQDSTTCLAWALDRFAQVETVSFDYGQRHRIELDCGKTIVAEMRQVFAPWARRLGEDHRVDLGVLGRLSETALTRDVAIALGENGLPTTFVPGRNLLFLTFAAVPTAAMTPSRRCSWRSISAWSAASSSTRR